MAKKVFVILGVLLVLAGILMHQDLLLRQLPDIEPLTSRSSPIQLKLLSHQILLKAASFPGIDYHQGEFWVTAGVFGEDHLPHQWVFKYDERLKPTGWSKPLTHTRYPSGEPDAQFKFYQGHFYQSYNASSDITADPCRGDQLWLAKYDQDFNLVKSLQVVRDADPEEETNDMFIQVARDRIYLGTELSAVGHEYRIEDDPDTPPGLSLSARGLIVRIFDLELKLLKTLRLEVPGLYMRSGGNLMWVKPYFYLFINTLTSFNFDPRDMCVLVFDQNFHLLKIKKLTDSLIYVEKFPQGVLSAKGRFYIPYTRFPNVEYAYFLMKSLYYSFSEVKWPFLDQRCYPQDTGEIWVNVYDLDFNLLNEVPVAAHPPRCGVGSHRGHLAKAGDDIYVLYDTQYSFKPSAPQIEACHLRIIRK